MRFGLAAFIMTTSLVACQAEPPTFGLPDLTEQRPTDTSHTDSVAGDPEVSDQLVETSPEDVPPIGDTATPQAIREVEWYDFSVGYEIYVRSFQDSDGDGIGDIQGIIDRLDYLNDGDTDTDDDLGVDLIWLMPINPSPSIHGYDVTDYRAVNPEYGDSDDVRRLFSEAETRGIRVILDLVINHSSSNHRWFQSANQGRDSDYRDYYVWSEEPRDWARPWGPGQTWYPGTEDYYYALFWQGMPDLNFESSALRQEVLEIGTFWIEQGASGFRLDAARYLIETGEGVGQSDTAETHAFWRQFRYELAQVDAAHLLVGEVWTDWEVVETYFGTIQDRELQMVFDFDRAEAVETAIVTGSLGPLRNTLCGRPDPLEMAGATGAFLSNHDTDRVATTLGTDQSTTLELAAALLLLTPGTPWLYYGEEIGMENGVQRSDEAKRLPMQWSGDVGEGFTTATPWRSPAHSEAGRTVQGQLLDPDSLLRSYQRLIRIRRDAPALAVGTVECLEWSQEGVLAVRREFGSEVVYTVFNLSSSPVTFSEIDGQDGPFMDLWSETSQPVIELSAEGFAVFSLGSQR